MVTKNIILFLLIFTLTSCLNERSDINSVVKSYMTNNVDDPSKYEFVDIQLIDSTMVTADDTLTHNLILGKPEKQMDLIAYVANKNSVLDSIKQTRALSNKFFSIYYIYRHKFRESKEGEKKMKTMYFILNRENTRVIFAGEKLDEYVTKPEYY